MVTPRPVQRDDARHCRRAARGGALAVAVIALLLPAGVRAQSSSDQAAAEALFKQGRDLMAAGQYGEGCPKLAESERLDPAPGTLLNLATCYERNGQVTSAWVTFKEAATAARKADQSERERLATEKAAALEPSLPTLTILVSPKADQPDLEVRRDGEIVGRAEWGAPIPVDPGVHVIDARAPGRKPWQGQVPPVAIGTKASLEVPPLAPLPENEASGIAPYPAGTSPASGVPGAAPTGSTAPAVEPPGPAAPTHPGATQRLVAGITGGVGLASIAAGAVLGALAMSDNNQAASSGCISNVCNQQSYATGNDAKHAATASTIAFAVGGGLVAAGVVLWLTSPGDARGSGVRAGLVPAASTSSAGAMLQGSF
jgi:hypothetical protein